MGHTNPSSSRELGNGDALILYMIELKKMKTTSPSAPNEKGERNRQVRPYLNPKSQPHASFANIRLWPERKRKERNEWWRVNMDGRERRLTPSRKRKAGRSICWGLFPLLLSSI
jgi:hypothetical protein|uniref:Uncharacterized protein n=1 Tax=Picea glauca TaxID=3330 RepID=A0A101M3W1_PICGL|nr:hypothetical protein ABT39_MTgene458 [Picea glauca]